MSPQALVSILLFMSPAAASERPRPSLPLRAATLTYGERSSARCFSEAFLELVRGETNVEAPGKLASVALGGEALFRHPFALLSGEGYFRFTGEERGNLREYLLNGGFVLASAGCSSAAWDASFREQIREVLPEFDLVPLPNEHLLLRLLFDTRPLRLKDGAPAALEAIVVEGRIVLVYSQAGLNDTASLPDCCCCTGNEVRGSAFLNANIFLYAILSPAEG